jgi:hypothetical protein
MSFTADEYEYVFSSWCRKKKTRHLTARTYAMRFPNGRHPSMNVKRRFDQRLRDKKM